MSVRLCCDFCNRILPTEMEDTCFGPLPCPKNNFTKELNTRKLFPSLCKECADKIDLIVLLAKDEWLKQIDISVKNSRINAARKELLGTKG